MKEQICFIYYMEKVGYLDCVLEYILDDEILFECERQGMGLICFEFLVLMVYGKMVLKEELVSEEIV